MDCPDIVYDVNNIKYKKESEAIEFCGGVSFKASNGKSEKYIVKVFDRAGDKEYDFFASMLEERCCLYSGYLTDIILLSPPHIGYIARLPENSVILSDWKMIISKMSMEAVKSVTALFERLQKSGLCLCGQVYNSVVCSNYGEPQKPEIKAELIAPELIYRVGEFVPEENIPFLCAPEAASARLADWQEMSYALAQLICHLFAGFDMIDRENAEEQFNQLGLGSLEGEAFEEDDFEFEFEDSVDEQETETQAEEEPLQKPRDDIGFLIVRAFLEKKIKWIMDAECTEAIRKKQSYGRILLNPELIGMIGRAIYTDTDFEVRPTIKEWKAALRRFENEIHFCPKCGFGLNVQGSLENGNNILCVNKQCELRKVESKGYRLEIQERFIQSSVDIFRQMHTIFDSMGIRESREQGVALLSQQEIVKCSSRLLCTRYIPDYLSDGKYIRYIMRDDFFEEQPENSILLRYYIEEDRSLMIGVDDSPEYQVRQKSGASPQKENGICWYRNTGSKNDTVALVILKEEYHRELVIKAEKY